jgi:hypothetical protein
MTRTCDLRFRKPPLYPAELRDRRPLTKCGSCEAAYQSSRGIATPGEAQALLLPEYGVKFEARPKSGAGSYLDFMQNQHFPVATRRA